MNPTSTITTRRALSPKSLVAALASVALLVGCGNLGSVSTALGASQNVSIQFEDVLLRNDPFSTPEGVHVQVTNFTDAAGLNTFEIRSQLVGSIQTSGIPVVVRAEDADTIVRIDILDMQVTDQPLEPRGSDYAPKLQSIGAALGGLAVIDALGKGGESANDLAKAAASFAAAGSLVDMFGSMLGLKPLWATLVVQITLIERGDYGQNVGKSTTAVAYVKGSKNNVHERVPDLQKQLVERVAQLVQ